MMSGAITNLSIELIEGATGPFKSIGNIQWTEIPSFAVLTGLNGSGKTQLLQVLGYKLSNVYHPQHLGLNNFTVVVKGDDIGQADVAYLPNSEGGFQAVGANIGSIANAKRQFLEQLRPQNTQQNIDKSIQRALIERTYGLKLTNAITDEQIDKLPDDFHFMLEYSDVSVGLGHVFYGYQVRRAEILMDGKTEADVVKELGPSPWELVNDSLAAAGFNYQIAPPTNKILKTYEPKLIANGKELTINMNDLSSGEKIILRTLLWFYNSKQNNIFPKLVLLDEPDAHLHPSMTQQFIDVLKGVLVDQYGVRVILTTHSPSTVALSPEESIFVMSREQPRIQRAKSKAEAIGMLTSGLVIVSPGTRFIFVEDADDKKFYEAVRDVLFEQGPSKDPMVLKPAPSLVFLPASIGKGPTKTGGGKSAVVQWVNKLNAFPLDEMMRGIIDLDSGNAGDSRIKVLSRYSIENYQLDPFVVFGVLVDEGKAPALPGISITKGDEHLLRTLGVGALQRIVTWIAAQIEPLLGTLQVHELTKVTVKFTNSMSLDYPAWMTTKRGHDLLPIFQRAFGQTVITPPKLETAFRRVRLVPIELRTIMSDLQA